MNNIILQKTCIVKSITNYYIINRHEEMWVKKTPEELIWGYHEGLFDLAELGGFPVPPNGVFGFFSKVGISYHLSHTVSITYFI